MLHRLKMAVQKPQPQKQLLLGSDSEGVNFLAYDVSGVWAAGTFRPVETVAKADNIYQHKIKNLHKSTHTSGRPRSTAAASMEHLASPTWWHGWMTAANCGSQLQPSLGITFDPSAPTVVCHL